VHAGECLIRPGPVQRENPGQAFPSALDIVEPAGILQNHGMSQDPGTLTQVTHDALDVCRPELVVEDESRPLLHAGVQVPRPRR
jgi:hypothetical protein